jgi:hypothetical protein
MLKTGAMHAAADAAVEQSGVRGYFQPNFYMLLAVVFCVGRGYKKPVSEKKV